MLTKGFFISDSTILSVVRFVMFFGGMVAILFGTVVVAITSAELIPKFKLPKIFKKK